jgi:hypothetical protein
MGLTLQAKKEIAMLDAGRWLEEHNRNISVEKRVVRVQELSPALDTTSPPGQTRPTFSTTFKGNLALVVIAIDTAHHTTNRHRTRRGFRASKWGFQRGQVRGCASFGRRVDTMLETCV